MGPAWGLYNPSDFQKSLKILDDFLEQFVQKAISQTEEEFNQKQEKGEVIHFVDSLSQFTKDRQDLRDQSVNILFGQKRYDGSLSFLVILRIGLSSASLRDIKERRFYIRLGIGAYV